MNFESALQAMRCGRRVSRESWDDTEFIAIHKPGFFSLRRLPYIYFVDRDTSWRPTQFDVMADDWMVV